MKKHACLTSLLLMLLLSFGLQEITAQNNDEETKGKDEEQQNAWKVNPFAKNKYVPPYPPDKYTYKAQDDKLIYKGTYSYETKTGGKLFAKEEGEDFYIDFVSKNMKKIDLPTGSKHGIGTLQEEIKLLKENEKEKENKNTIKRNENIIKILEKTQRKISVFDIYRYRLRHPLKFYTIQDDKPVDMTQQLYDSAQMGYMCNMIQTQIDEGGLFTEDGSRLAKRDEKEDLSTHIGLTYNWWNIFFNHWFNLEEFPILPSDIDYVRQRQYFQVENMNADWEVSLKESKKDKSVDPIDMYCKRWWGKNLKESFPEVNDFSYKGMKPIIGFINQEMKKSDNQYRDWVRGEFKDKYLKNEDLYSFKNGTIHKESEAISRRKDNSLAFVNNECEFIGKEKIEITGLNGQIGKYNCLHFRRNITIDDLGIPVLKLDMKKWQDDIWFDPMTRLTMKRDFILDFDATFISQVPSDPKNPQSPKNIVTEINGTTYKFTIELVDTSRVSGKAIELKTFKDIVNSFNTAVGAEYKIVLENLEKYKVAYMDKVKNHEFTTAVDIMMKQCKSMAEIFTQSKGFKKNNPIFADEYFYTYVPEDFNATDKYGLIVYLPDENENVEEKTKEIGSLLLGKKFIAVVYRPQLNKYDHKFEQSSKRLLTIIRGIGNTYNIDPKKRYMLGAGEGGQMVLSMLSYTLSDFDRFALYIPLSDGYLPFADDCRKNINSPHGANYQESIFSSNILVMYPTGTNNIKQEGEAPDACIALSVTFANIRAHNPKFDKYISRLIHQEKDVCNKAVVSYIINQIIPKFEKGSKDFFENPANTPGLQPLIVVSKAPGKANTTPSKKETTTEEDAQKKKDTEKK